MAFPTNPQIGDTYNLLDTEWTFDGALGWYKARRVGRNNDLIKIYAPSTVITDLASHVHDLENRLASFESKTFLELE